MAGPLFAYDKKDKPRWRERREGWRGLRVSMKMKTCHSVRELIKMLEKGIPATLVVYGSATPEQSAGIWGYGGGTSLTLNVQESRHGQVESRVTYCSWPTYTHIKRYLTILPPPCPEEAA